MSAAPLAILLALLSGGQRPPGAAQFEALSAEEWQDAAGLAQKHGVSELFYHHARKMNAPLPADLAAALKLAARRNALRNLQMYEDLKKVLETLHEGGIPVIPLKGARLAEACYEDISLRSMGDADLLVRPSDLERMDDALLKLGCQPLEHNRVIRQDRQHFVYRLPRSGIPLEMHWTILPPKAAFQLDEEQIWQRAAPAPLAGAPALAFTPEDMLLHLCMHTAKHADWLRLRMFYDIAALLRAVADRLDWQVLAERAQRWEALRPLWFSLRMTEDLLGTQTPAGWLDSIQPGNASDAYLRAACEQISGEHSGLNPSDDSFHASRLWSAPGLSAKLDVLRYGLFPPRQVIERRYPVRAGSWMVWLYYPARMLDVTARFFRAALRMGRSEATAAMNSAKMEELRDWLVSG